MAKDNKTASPATAIGIDIGGTGMKGGIVDLQQGKLIGERFRIPTPKPSTPEAVADVVGEIVEELMKRDAAPDPSTPVGAAFPAIIDDGVARSAANVDKTWIDADVDGIFTARLGREVHIINDADAAGLAEARYGAGRGVKGSVLAITLGTGIGSAMLYNGTLIPNFELGHLEVDGHDAESRASASAREREDLPWPEYSERLQRYFSHVEFLFSPKLFIIGGGISKRAEDFLPNLDLRTPTVVAELKNNAGIVGAALQAALHFDLVD
ncbi:ROK family protein [Zhihengliuella alba]|uniref:ROK family protein n=1 Tax=Zhihengliuella alba TaxID=547018 RepID=A0ABP7CTZ7_9MICC